jgi:hypothetical protein
MTYTHRAKRIKIVVEKKNPGEVTVLNAETVPTEEWKITESTIHPRNPNKIRLLKLNPDFLDTLEIWYYKDSRNPHIGLALNQDYTFLDEKNLKLVYLALREALTIVKRLKAS